MSAKPTEKLLGPISSPLAPDSCDMLAWTQTVFRPSQAELRDGLDGLHSATSRYFYPPPLFLLDRFFIPPGELHLTTLDLRLGRSATTAHTFAAGLFLGFPFAGRHTSNQRMQSLPTHGIGQLMPSCLAALALAAESGAATGSRGASWGGGRELRQSWRSRLAENELRRPEAGGDIDGA